jgi:predicted enzyme related to lactoylglutathione lyase
VTNASDTRPAIVGVTVYTTRPGDLASFYAKVLGTPLDGGVDHLSGESMVRARLDDLEFEIVGSASAASGGASVQPSIQVADVAAAVQRVLDADGSVHMVPAEHDWGTYAIVADPDGNRLGLYAPVFNSDLEGTA